MVGLVALKSGKWWKKVLMALLAILVLVALAVWIFLRGSLAQLDGEIRSPGLISTVKVSRDALGIPTITGTQRDDVAYATGYIHAQDRFFQMDLLRRVAAGELAELFGAAALDQDRQHRLHRFRARAKTALMGLSAPERHFLDRYVEGVNAGLAALTTRPFEYGLLQTQPVPWRAEDSFLVVCAMYFDLQADQQVRKLTRGWLADHSTPEQLKFLLPTSSKWDAPLDATNIDEPPAALPSSPPEWYGQAGTPKRLAYIEQRYLVGSNNWAVSGARSETGAAIVANDMHLGLRLPGAWYRAALEIPGADGKPRRISGVTLPGAPLVVVGSNGHIAWAHTNSYGDYLDLIELEHDPLNPQRFRMPGGWEDAAAHHEMLAVKGAAAQDFVVLETSLGPVWKVADKEYAVHWVAHAPGAVNLNMLKLEQADDLATAQAIGHTAGMPAQNMLVGDVGGQIGWTIDGPMPDRQADPAANFPFKVDAQAKLGWSKLRGPDGYPSLNAPQDGQLWTANARQLAKNYATLGDGGTDLGARARQIRDDLTQLGQKTNEKGVYSVFLDNRAVYIGVWRDRALKVLTPQALAGQPQRAEFRRLLETSWDGHASIDSVGYRLARGYLNALYAQLFGGVDATLKKIDGNADFDRASLRWPAVIARLLDEQPLNWLPPGKADWNQVQLAAIDEVITDLTKDGKPLSAATWGSRNKARITHPFTRILPMLKPFLSAPEEQQAGDTNMPRVSGPDFGQSERMSVSPGHEEQGILNMPGGQSGHPLSPYFLAGHSDWIKANPAPFLPGPAVHTLVFTVE